MTQRTYLKVSHRAAGVLSAAFLFGVSGCTFNQPSLPAFDTDKTVIAPPPSGLEPTDRSPSSCGAESFDGLVGRKFDPTIDLPKGTRVIRPGEFVTQDYIPQRLNIRLDENGVVISVKCG